MVCGNSPRAAALIVFVACAVVIAPTQQSDDVDALIQQGEQLYHAGKYTEPTSIAKHALAVAEHRFGPDGATVATAVSDLALLYEAQGHYAEAEPLMKRALAIAARWSAKP